MTQPLGVFFLYTRFLRLLHGIDDGRHRHRYRRQDRVGDRNLSMCCEPGGETSLQVDNFEMLGFELAPALNMLSPTWTKALRLPNSNWRLWQSTLLALPEVTLRVSPPGPSQG